ncbi:hypothetical protein K488DRAFT_80404 [Vararia minispora EC-137]|uniref:Uncharacterized protein n=1 Tax=Vararia minispora EC-137 TaxID=1314806 RepID=A0ACB8QB58_9AGAM|nr:hypothetical protein K488DRAFT_80404 [Vararia minispora EC-137]
MAAKLQSTLTHLAGKDKDGTEAPTHNGKPLPAFDDLPRFHEFAGCAWDAWGKGDQLGTVNLLTDAVVQRAAEEEIRTGQAVSLSWPINFPEKPVFGRKKPEITTFFRPGQTLVRDDELHINTQSGTQWDGYKHFPVLRHATIYGGVKVDELPNGQLTIPDPMNVDPELIKMGIHNWARHGICGRGVLLDLVTYFTRGGSPLPYDPWTTHGLSVADLEACAAAQGVRFRAGDALLLRVGFIEKYMRASRAERDALADRPETFAGIEQSEDMKRFLWNNHFAAIASDQPALESWPPQAGGEFMHETILGMWGMPLGEFFDLEKLSAVCRATGRYTFFFTSWPLNVLGGVASPPNAAAYF